ncbi:MAG: LysR substrate-binding domain-containing protein [Pseudomonadales bacterium]
MKRSSLSGQIADIDLKLLRIFKTVVECGGFSAAEVELNIGRSAISRQMSDLEARLDMHLCQRGRSGFQLTDHGRLIYEAIQELVIDLEKFRANVNAVHSHLIGEVTLGLTDNMLTDPNSPVVEILGAFHQQEPGVKINLQVAAPNEVERAVIEGRFNIGIIPQHHDLSGLEYYDLYDETSLFYCGHNHPLFNVPDDQVNIDTISQYDFIAPGYTHLVMLKKQFPQLKASATSYQVEGIATLILSGQYVGFLPKHYAVLWSDKQLMRALLPQTLNYKVPFKVIVQPDSRPNMLRKTLLNAFKKYDPR